MTIIGSDGRRRDKGRRAVVTGLRARRLGSDDTRHVGFNPYRPQRRRQSDYAFVAAAFLVMVVLLGWAFL